MLPNSLQINTTHAELTKIIRAPETLRKLCILALANSHSLEQWFSLYYTYLKNTDNEKQARACKGAILCSLVLNSLNIPPSLRPTPAITAGNNPLLLIADYLWLQKLYNSGKLKLSAKQKKPRVLAVGGETQAEQLLRAIEAALYRSDGNPSKAKGSWRFLRINPKGQAAAFERQLIAIPMLYDNDTINWLARNSTSTQDVLEQRPYAAKNRYPEKHNTLTIWRCTVICYGRYSEAAAIYTALTNIPISRQGMANQIVRLERILPSHLHLWKYKPNRRI